MEAHSITASKSLDFTEVRTLLEKGIEDGVAPGMVLLVGRYGEELFKESFGTKSNEELEESIRLKMEVDTVFDIASVTSIITASIIMKLVEAGKLRLEDRVSRYVQGFSVHGKSAITVEHLLSHSSGLIAWKPYFEKLVKENQASRMGILTSRGARDFIINDITRSELEYVPGTKQVYSDSGLILLGYLVEILTGLTLERAAQNFVLGPLMMRSTSFIDLSMIKRRGIHPVKDLIAPTENCPWRKRTLWGEVHDDNAWAIGGIAGHSGLFSSASDLHRFADEILKAYRGSSAFMTRQSARKMIAGASSDEIGKTDDIKQWRYGWDTPCRDNGMNDSGLSEFAVGMCGFTGCSLWLEPERGVDIILMSNRIHPTRNNKKIRAFRATLHAAIVRALT